MAGEVVDPYLAGELKGQASIITWAGTNKQKVNQLYTLLSRSHGAASGDTTGYKSYLDEMTPACRNTLLVTLAALEASVVNV